MTNTVQIKKQQLSKGFFTIGNGPEVVLIMGSCRVVNYITYLHGYDKNRFTIHSIDPFNFNWDAKDNRVDYVKAIEAMENHTALLKMLASVNVFIHEYYANFGMFNCDRNAEKNIYQFCMSPAVDVCIPNFNDVFILFGDIVTFDNDLRKMAIQDYLVTDKLSDQTELMIIEKSESNLAKFYEICLKSDLPELMPMFKEWHLRVRMYWTYNHVSKFFTLAVMKLMNEKYLNLPGLVLDETHEDIFANNYTYLTEYDRKRGYDWDEEVKPLRNKLF